jgi:hypothetical protein
MPDRILHERGLDGVGVAGLCRAVGASKETLVPGSTAARS